MGKTSTKEIIASVLAQKYRVLKTHGNFNNELGLATDRVPPARGR
ncbi:MAG: Mur ligase family protein [Lachnospiraceae bacterium]